MFDSFRAIVKKVDEDGGRKLIELSSINNQTSTIEIEENLDEWMWMSFSISREGEMKLHIIYDKKTGRLMGQTTLQGQTLAENTPICPEEDVLPSSRKNNLKMTLFSQPVMHSDGSKVAFAPIKTVDLSFIIMHETILSSDEISALRKQVRRYDVKA